MRFVYVEATWGRERRLNSRVDDLATITTKTVGWPVSVQSERLIGYQDLFKSCTAGRYNGLMFSGREEQLNKLVCVFESHRGPYSSTRPHGRGGMPSDDGVSPP